MTKRYDFCEGSPAIQRKIGRDDFNQGSELWKVFTEARTWLVCEEYEIRDGCIRAKCLDPIWGTRWGWKTYRPLEDTPDLFLELARLHEKSDFEEASLAFSHKYGILGGRNDQYERWLHEMDLPSLREETKRAWGILKMYEAALNRDWEAAKLHCSEHRDELGVLELPGRGSSWGISREEVPEMYLEDALLGAMIMVEKTVKKLCRLGSIFTKSAIFPEVDPAGVKGVWVFNNLLGAAYLQMYWLMTSGGDIARCEYCGLVMSLARPHPDGRKRRQDRKFCNDACRQAHHRSKNEH